MNKNTVIAVILSTLVVIATFFMQTYLFPNSSKSSGNNLNQTDNSVLKENVPESEALENQVFFNEENSAECMKYFYEIEAEYAIFMRILFPILS